MCLPMLRRAEAQAQKSSLRVGQPGQNAGPDDHSLLVPSREDSKDRRGRLGIDICCLPYGIATSKWWAEREGVVGQFGHTER